MRVEPGRPGACATIAEALGADRVEIAEGEYEETLEITSDVVIEALGTVVLRGGIRAADCTVTVKDLAITSPHGTAVSMRNGDLTLIGCRITDSAQGVRLEGASGKILDTSIKDIRNDGIVIGRASDPFIGKTTITGCGQRGIYVHDHAKPVIEDCEVRAVVGDGISVTSNSAPTIRRTAIQEFGGRALTGPATVEDCHLDGTGAPDDLLDGLDAMVGLPGVKDEVRSIVDEIQVAQWRRSAGLAVGSASRHLIFTGAPGTGKTTVARIYGKLLKSLGVLPRGQFKEVSRRDLVGQYIGHTAEKTASVFDECRGGVLFIDEAYTLSRGAGSTDFGQEAIDTLVKLMEDHREDVAVIVAGYTAEMDGFLAANPGLASRFAKSIEFENYTPADLVEIVSRMVRDGDYVLDPECAPVLARHFAEQCEKPDFGNAREARRLLEKMRKEQARRLRALGRVPDADELRGLVVNDAIAAVAGC